MNLKSSKKNRFFHFSIRTYLLLVGMILMLGSINAQKQTTCKVLMPSIAGTYKGHCKNGLADGKGKAKGIDTYVGKFKNGWPDGKGKYSYQNGNVYNGYWTHGVKNGEGVFVYTVNGKKNVLRGYWKDGEYAGTNRPDRFYRVTNQTGITNFTIRKMEGDQQQIVISIINQVTKYIPRDLELNVSNGKVERQNNRVVVTLFNVPVNCNIHYTIRVGTIAKQCFLSFEVLKPGNYHVQITNE